MPPDRFGWCVLCRCMHVPKPVEARTWRALCRFDTGEVQALRFALNRLSACPSWEVAGAVLRSHPLQPQPLVEMLEQLVQRGNLARHDATTIEECVFANLTPGGAWR
jgi:hypothetical protein